MAITSDEGGKFQLQALKMKHDRGEGNTVLVAT
jgi:hypothetical protein